MLENEEFTLTPGLGEAMMANPFKSLLMLGVTFYAGAVVGKTKTDKAIGTVTGLVKSGASSASSMAKKKLEQRRSMPEMKQIPVQGSSYRKSGSYYY
jgi:hypothetical protein